MIDRFKSRITYRNEEDLYSNFLEERNVKFIRHFTTAELTFPSDELLYDIDVINHIWSTGDRYYKLANKYYGDSKDWWIIAQFNKKPTESHIKIGDVIMIPIPLHQAIIFLKG